MLAEVLCALILPILFNENNLQRLAVRNGYALGGANGDRWMLGHYPDARRTLTKLVRVDPQADLSLVVGR